MATDKGSVIASIILAHNYICGVPVKKDLNIAYKYKDIAVKNGARSRDLEDINKTIKDNCVKSYDADSGIAFRYTAKDAVNDYFSRNRFMIGIIPSVFESLQKK